MAERPADGAGGFLYSPISTVSAPCLPGVFYLIWIHSVCAQIFPFLLPTWEGGSRAKVRRTELGTGQNVERVTLFTEVQELETQET